MSTLIKQLTILAIVVLLIFALPGHTQNPSNGQGQPTNLVQIAGQASNNDPCGSWGTTKLTAFKNITTATTTALVAPSGSTNIFVCGISMDISSTTASTVIFENGTGASCVTSPNALTHTYTNSTLVNAYKFYGGGEMTVFSTGTSQGLCALTTVGTSPTIGITVTYVQQ